LEHAGDDCTESGPLPVLDVSAVDPVRGLPRGGNKSKSRSCTGSARPGPGHDRIV